MATEKQIAANRANALKSTGPRTTLGKARASRNAVKEGFTADELQALSNPRSSLARHAAAVRAYYQPGDKMETYFVDIIIAKSWRARQTAKQKNVKNEPNQKSTQPLESLGDPRAAPLSKQTQANPRPTHYAHQRGNTPEVAERS